MTDRVVVSADRTRLLPPSSPEKGYRITRKEAAELGLLETEEKPAQKRRPRATTDEPKPRRTPKSE